MENMVVDKGGTGDSVGMRGPPRAPPAGVCGRGRVHGDGAEEQKGFT